VSKNTKRIKYQASNAMSANDIKAVRTRGHELERRVNRANGATSEIEIVMAYRGRLYLLHERVHLGKRLVTGSPLQAEAVAA
jgi:hypothetical protein